MYIFAAYYNAVVNNKTAIRACVIIIVESFFY